jgi:hypothetical protein
MAHISSPYTKVVEVVGGRALDPGLDDRVPWRKGYATRKEQARYVACGGDTDFRGSDQGGARAYRPARLRCFSSFLASMTHIRGFSSTCPSLTIGMRS